MVGPIQKLSTSHADNIVGDGFQLCGWRLLKEKGIPQRRVETKCEISSGK
jgi:hypothetical protein